MAPKDDLWQEQRKPREETGSERFERLLKQRGLFAALKDALWRAKKEDKFQEGGKIVPVSIGTRLKRAATWTVVIIILLTLFRWIFVTYPGPAYWVVTQNIYWSKGLADKPLPIRYNVLVPVQTVTHKLPRLVQLLELDRNWEQYKKAYRGDKIIYRPEQAVDTTDGFQVKNDTGILYRIFNPVLAIKECGVGDGYLTKGVLPIVENCLKNSLGLLETEMYFKFPVLRDCLATGEKEDFEAVFANYKETMQKLKNVHEGQKDKVQISAQESSFARDVAQLQLATTIAERGSKGESLSAKQRFNERLRPKGIEVLFVPSLYFSFNEDIQKRIKEKVQKEQQIEVNKSKTLNSEAEAQLKKIDEEGKQKVAILKSKGGQYQKEVEGQKERYKREKTSSGLKEVELANAYKTRREREALELSGSRNWVFKEAVQSWDGTEIMVVSTEDVLKLFDSWGK